MRCRYDSKASDRGRINGGARGSDGVLRQGRERGVRAERRKVGRRLDKRLDRWSDRSKDRRFGPVMGPFVGPVVGSVFR